MEKGGNRENGGRDVYMRSVMVFGQRLLNRESFGGGVEEV
jgi:hypothetical protein